MTDRSTSAVRARRDTEVRSMMMNVIRAYREERGKLAERLKTDHALNPFVLRPVLKVQADVIPWVRVQGLVTKGTNGYKAMMEVRSYCARTLLDYAEASGSDMLVAEIDRMEREGMRRYLKMTARFVPGTSPEAVALGENTEETEDPDITDVVKGLRKQANDLRLLGRDAKAIELFKMADEMERQLIAEAASKGKPEGE